MTTRHIAYEWLEKNHPLLAGKDFRASKHFDRGLWFFTFPKSYFDPARTGVLKILLQEEKSPTEFHFLLVPFSFLRNNQPHFDVRADRTKFDLHISSKRNNWLICERSQNVSFAEFEQ